MTATAIEYPRHVLVATEDEEGMDYRVVCDAADPHTAACAMWVECGCEPGEDPALTEEEPCPSSPTGEHRLFVFGLAKPAGECFVAANPHLGDAARDLHLCAPGCYEVDYDVVDEEGLNLLLAGSEPSA